MEKSKAFSWATICPDRRGTLEAVGDKEEEVGERLEEEEERGGPFTADLMTDGCWPQRVRWWPLLLLSLLLTRSEPVSCCCILPAR